MTILVSSGCEVYDYPCPHDPDEETYYYFSYRPPVREDDKLYYEELDVIIPATPTGFMYTCISSGKSFEALEAAALVYPTKKGATLADGTILWQATPYKAFLFPDETILTSSWVLPTEVTISDEALYAGFLTSFKLLTTPSSGEIIITNEVTVQRAGGNTEKRHRSFKLTLSEL